MENNIERHQTNSTSALHEAVKIAIVTLSMSQANPPNPIPREQGKVWTQFFLAAGIRPEEIMPAVIEYGQKSKFWPSVHELIQAAKSLRPSRTFDELCQARAEAVDEMMALEGPAMTAEALAEYKQEVLDGMRDGPRRLFLDLLAGTERTETPQQYAYRVDTEEEMREARVIREAQLRKLAADREEGAAL